MASIDRIGGDRGGVDGARQTATARPRGDTPAFPGVAEPEAEAGGAAQTGTATPALAMDGLLALQESVGQATTSELERDHKAREHGRRLLTALGGLQHLVLSDGDPGPVLHQLHALAEDEPEAAADPALAAALGAIRLRVLVELARRGL